jgi:hypothetical protein
MRSLVYSDLWPDVPEARARDNLRRALWQLPRGWVRVEGPDLVLDAASTSRRRGGWSALDNGRVTLQRGR